MNPIYSRNRYSGMQSLGSDVLILYIFSELICANLGDFILNFCKGCQEDICALQSRFLNTSKLVNTLQEHKLKTSRQSNHSVTGISIQTLIFTSLLHCSMQQESHVLTALKAQKHFVIISSHHKCLPAGGHIKGEKLQNSHLTSSSTHSPINHAAASFTLELLGFAQCPASPICHYKASKQFPTRWYLIIIQRPLTQTSSVTHEML